MIRKTIFTAMVFAAAAAMASAQDARVELSATAGWTFSDGVSGSANDNSPVRVDPKDAFSWGARIGFLVGENVEVGGLFGMQSTSLETPLYPSPKVAVRLETRWTPTYVKSDAVGYWCDPYWGCYTVGDAQYANQFELSGGLTLRF